MGTAKRVDLPGKDRRLVQLGDLPLVAETPAHLLDDDTTPLDRLFIRNNGLVPPETDDPGAWTLTIDGEVTRPLRLTLDDLKRQFEPVTHHLVMECAGNGRAAFDPPVPGNQWTVGGVACLAWTGVPLAALLDSAGLMPSAVYTGHYGADRCIQTGATGAALSRGMPIAKALDPHTLVAFAANGVALPHPHGGPLRLVVPGWPGSLSQKWLTRIAIRDREHDGPGMGGIRYRQPATPLPPGRMVSDAEAEALGFRIIEDLPVRAIITAPADGAVLPAVDAGIELRGAAWAGARRVARVEISTDAGATWRAAQMAPPRNRFDWVRWTCRLPAAPGLLRVLVRATDETGATQPLEPAWNPGGYGGNAIHAITVEIV